MSLPDIQGFKNSLLRGGARSSYFLVQGLNIGSIQEFSYLCRAASLPAAKVGTVEVAAPGGRKIKLSGPRTFDDWQITVYNDTNMVMRSRFEAWQTACSNWDSPAAFDNIDAYASNQWNVTQLDRAGRAMRAYQFFNMWPTELAAIELSFDAETAIEQFTVTMAYSHFVPVATNGNIGPAGVLGSDWAVNLGFSGSFNLNFESGGGILASVNALASIGGSFGG
jgi:hypothetical protein